MVNYWFCLDCHRVVDEFQEEFERSDRLCGECNDEEEND